VPVYGNRWFIDNIERCSGHVRMQKDAQRLKNMIVSQLAEITSLSPVEKPLIAPEQIGKNYDSFWKDDNIKNFPYLPLDPIRNDSGDVVHVGVQGYTKPPAIPPALVGLAQSLEVDMSDLMGNQDKAEQMGGNLSGKSIELIQNRLDMQSYIYMDNMKKAMQVSGKIWLSMARELYVEKGRKMKAVDKENKTQTLELLETTMDGETGETYLKNDLSEANFEVYASVGASTISRKESTIRSLMALMQITNDPNDMQVLSSMAMMNMEGEGIEDVREYYRKKLVNMGAIKPNEEEARQMAEATAKAEPSPQDQLAMALAEKEAALALKAQADAENTQVDTLKKAAEVDETVADTAKTYASIDQEDRKFALEQTRDRAAVPLNSARNQRQPQAVN